MRTNITDKTWNDFAKFVARGDPEEYNQAAVDRMTDIMEPYIVRVKGVKPQFKAINKTKLIDFVTQEGRDFYKNAYERFLIRKAKAEGRIAAGSGSRMEVLVAMMQFNIAAESNIDRARIIAKLMYEDVKSGKFAAVCAMKYKISISKIIKILMDDYHVPRSDISVIWGGSQVNLSKKAATKKAITENDDLVKALAAEGINLEAIGLGEDVIIQEEIKFDEKLRLSNQDPRQRQEEIDRFQKGLSHYCFFTMKAGGVGLSLHHTDAFTHFKCRRKESGYAVEEDIPKVPTRPRKLYSAPNYSGIDMVQTLGRCPRLTSLSDTEQILLFFAGTIEEDVYHICANKLRCLSKVIRNQENWEDMLTGNRDESYTKHMQEDAETPSDTEDDSLLGGASPTEEED